ncbi:WW domain-binding protein 4 [Phytophthora palmivora]|uniref:WW domain-binding protein 4 n=1 Tax=Phytophthora palmivora TaxID=4796 RepID=A0A2P4XVK7_9STRA|nr:WW domain-binding protein 4 [Phytophthora palmivora]
MADYWVSRERHYCKYCNVWMQSDKLSIKHHEQGRKHKDKVDETLKRKRKAKTDASNSEKELQDQLKEIEAAAQAKYAQDMARRAPPPPPRSGAPPPPPRNRTTPTPPSRTAQSNGNTAVALSGRQPVGVYRPPIVQEEEPEEDEDDHGVYAVRGVVYLEGKKHESQLETGSACQIWVEEAEQWIDALVEQATVHTVPNTDRSFRRFTVMYMLPLSEEAVKSGEKPKPMTEREVLADRLRIPLPDNVTLEAAEKMVEQWRNGGNTERSSVLIDETTGMGVWSTVEVRQIDESPEAVAKRAAEAEAETARLAEEQKRLEALEDFSSQGDNALGAFNPWGGSYKGVNLDDGAAAADSSAAPVPHREEEINITTNGNVNFKKRGQKKQKRRRIHIDDK